MKQITIDSIDSLIAKIIYLEDCAHYCNDPSIKILIQESKEIKLKLNQDRTNLYLVIRKEDGVLYFTCGSFTGSEPFQNESEFEDKVIYLKELFNIDENRFEIIS